MAGAIAASGHSTGTLTSVPSAHTVSFVTNDDAAPKVLVQHSPAHLAVADSYTVKSGDYLSGIAKSACGTPADWTGIYVKNEKTIGANPDVIEPGQTLTLDCTTAEVTLAVTPQEHWHHVNHLNHLARWKAPAAAPVQEESNTSPAPRSEPASPPQTYHGSSSMQQCIINAESGGNSQITNSSGHYGLYQFSESTWEEYGGSAGSFGNASVAEQNQVFDKAVATNGYSDWTPYDGC